MGYKRIVQNIPVCTLCILYWKAHRKGLALNFKRLTTMEEKLIWLSLAALNAEEGLRLPSI